jgi:AraC-like DNA-binding protein
MGGVANELSEIAFMVTRQIFGAGRIVPRRDWRMAPHSHPFHEVVVVTQGRLVLRVEGREVVAGRGSVLFYRAGLVHEERSDRRAPVGSLFLAFDPGEELPWVPLLRRDEQGRVRQLLAWMVEDELQRRGGEPGGRLLDALLGELKRLCVPPRDPWLEGILGFMRGNLGRAIFLDDLAREGGMSKFAFMRRFRKSSGRTPMEALRLARLAQARTLLLTTNLPVKAIAPAVGIGDEYQLSKLFRRYFRMSPREVRTSRK